MASPAQIPYRQKWQAAWQSASFRKKTIIGTVIIVLIMIAFPFFFQAIEKRHGMLLNDWLLEHIPSYNMSIAIFMLIWAMTLLTFIRCAQNPDIFLLFLWSYILLCFVRMITICIIPLEPPKDLVQLADPLSNTLYGNRFITRDLFFSGHTATLFLMFLCVQKKTDKILTLAATISIGCLLLIQHVHYTLDVLAAPFAAYFIYWLGKKIVLWGVGSQEPVVGSR